MLSMDEVLLARIDEAARGKRLSRSAFVSQLAARELGFRAPEEQAQIRAAVERVRELADRYGTGEGSLTQQIREMRDSR